MTDSDDEEIVIENHYRNQFSNMILLATRFIE
jgi:hypothetical protein